MNTPANPAAQTIMQAQQQISDLLVQKAELSRAITRNQDLIQSLESLALWVEPEPEPDPEPEVPAE